MVKKYIIGSLVLVILVTSIYIMMPGETKIFIAQTRSTFYVWENGSWVISGVEYSKLYNGSKLLLATFRNVTSRVDGNMTTITRVSRFKGATITDIYTFNGNTKDKELFPVSHAVNIVNGEGLIYQYEVQKLVYDGKTMPLDGTYKMSFGRNMKVEWQKANYYSKIENLSTGGKLTIKYKILSDNETYNVRLFDPILTANNVFTKLMSNKADVSSGEAIFEIYNPINGLDLKKYLSFNFQTISGKPVKSTEILILRLIPYQNPIYEKTLVNETCKNIINNNSPVLDCSYYIKNIIGYETLYKEEWVPVDFIDIGTYKIKIKAIWQPKLGSQKTDWVPTIIYPKGLTGEYQDKYLEKKEWAWWNTSYSNCRNLTIEEINGTTRIMTPLSFNVTGLTDKQADSDDIRLISAGCNLDGNPLAYEILTNTSNSVFIATLLNVTANTNTTYSIYWNESTVSSGEDASLFLYANNGTLLFPTGRDIGDSERLTLVDRYINASSVGGVTNSVNMTNITSISSGNEYFTYRVVIDQQDPDGLGLGLGDESTGGFHNYVVNPIFYGATAYCYDANGFTGNTLYSIVNGVENLIEVNTTWAVLTGTAGNNVTVNDGSTIVECGTYVAGGTVNSNDNIKFWGSVGWFRVREIYLTQNIAMNTYVDPIYWRLGSIETTAGLAPGIPTIQNPLNTTYANTSIIGLNFTLPLITGGTLDKCWYTSNGGSNVNLANCNNISDIIGDKNGLNNITIFVNASNGESNNFIRYYTIDGISPTINILDPLNISYLKEGVPYTLNLNWSGNEVSNYIKWVGYSLNNASTNITTLYKFGNVSGAFNTTIGLWFNTNQSVKCNNVNQTNLSAVHFDGTNFWTTDFSNDTYCIQKYNSTGSSLSNSSSPRGRDSITGNSTHLFVTTTVSPYNLTRYNKSDTAFEAINLFNFSQAAYGVAYDSSNPWVWALFKGNEIKNYDLTGVYGGTTINFTNAFNNSYNGYGALDFDGIYFWILDQPAVNTSLVRILDTTGSLRQTINLSEVVTYANQTNLTGISKYGNFLYIGSQHSAGRDKVFRYQLQTAVNGTINGTEGSNAITLYINDTFDNSNSTTVRFTINDTVPGISIFDPVNQTYNFSAFITALYLNVSANQTVDKWWYRLNRGNNISFTPNATFLPIGFSNNLTVYANDTTGKIGNRTVFFSVNGTDYRINLTSAAYRLNISTGTIIRNASLTNITWLNAEPENQTSNRGLYNVTNTGITNFVNVTARTNESFPACMNFWLGSVYNKTQAKNITTSDQVILSTLNTSNSIFIWNWVDMFNCTAGTKFGGKIVWNVTTI